jgi:hypothetical protein
MLLPFFIRRKHTKKVLQPISNSRPAPKLRSLASRSLTLEPYKVTWDFNIYLKLKYIMNKGERWNSMLELQK